MTNFVAIYEFLLHYFVFMRITLIGYGKMGKAIEKIALERGHTIVHKIDQNNQHLLAELSPENTDVAIEFTNPESAPLHIRQCFAQKVPIVCGSTGWLAHKTELESLCEAQKGAFFYASNFSIGVNLFFQLNTYLASLMQNQLAYQPRITEIHHTEKKDAPSGTALTLAEGRQVEITSIREPNVPGTHSVFYTSAIDEIEIKHTAYSREGFATGAVLAAEWLQGRQGVFGMGDMLQTREAL